MPRLASCHCSLDGDVHSRNRRSPCGRPGRVSDICQPTPASATVSRKSWPADRGLLQAILFRRGGHFERVREGRRPRGSRSAGRRRSSFSGSFWEAGPFSAASEVFARRRSSGLSDCGTAPAVRRTEHLSCAICVAAVFVFPTHHVYGWQLIRRARPRGPAAQSTGLERTTTRRATKASRIARMRVMAVGEQFSCRCDVSG